MAKSKPKPPQIPSTVVSFRMPTVIWEQIKTMAAREERSSAKVITRLLRETLERK